MTFNELLELGKDEHRTDIATTSELLHFDQPINIQFTSVSKFMLCQCFSMPGNSLFLWVCYIKPNQSDYLKLNTNISFKGIVPFYL